jgi:hypothetical protein
MCKSAQKGIPALGWVSIALLLQTRKEDLGLTAYRGLKGKLIEEFSDDTQLIDQIMGARTFDEIVVALGANYRDWLLAAAQAASGLPSAATASVEAADRAADARERALLEVMAFFERDYAATGALEVRRTGTSQLRVIRNDNVEAGP